MLNSNFKILIRGLWRKKSFSLLNIAGLAVGIAVSLLIVLLIRYELSIDSFHSKRDRIYRVVSVETYRNGTTDYDGCVPTPLADALRREFPQAEEVAAVWKVRQWTCTVPGDAKGLHDGTGDAQSQRAGTAIAGGADVEKQVRVSEAYYADSTLFNIFDFPWLAGNPGTALREPYTIAIARTVANNWFGHWQDALGKTVWQGDGRKPYRITGVLEDPRSNTDMPLQVVVSYATFRIQHEQYLADPMSWDDFSFASQCFFLLRRGQRIQSMEALLPQFVATHFTPLFARSDSRDSCFFQPLTAMHFNSRIDHYGGRGWTYLELWSMALIGIFLLAVACINFINLSTAQSLNRAKEVGVRKVLGSSRRQLLVSFLQETALLVFLALVLGCMLAQLALPALRNILEKPVFLDILHSPATLLFLLGTWVLVTFLAGFYPGMVLSRFNPVDTFKSKIETRTAGGISLRRGLLVLQFAIAQLLIIGTLVIVRQMDFFRNRPMGFDRNAIALVTLPDNGKGAPKDAYFKSKILSIPGVLSASLCSDPPSTPGANEGAFTLENHPHPEDFELVRRFSDTAYLSVFHLGLVAGRYPYASDTLREAVLNETAVHMLGFPSLSDIIGKTIRLGQSPRKIIITGIVRDFHSEPLREKIKPLMIGSSNYGYNVLAVKLEPSKIKVVMPQLQAAFSEVYPGHFFDAPFFDDTVVDFYNAEAIESSLFKAFATLAIFISCLGLYGLVSFMAVQKTKEVGIRKVLGASVSSIVYMFSLEFTLLIGLAFLIAAPIGYYLTKEWLSGYYYHIEPGLEVFAIAISSSVLIAWITVGYKAVKAAIANPVKSLRTE
jgi:ABC-type lipoprotein release transport system permease subunit